MGVACPAWYALKVQARRELRAFQALNDKQFELFHPTITEERRYSDRIAVVQAPAFPGYLFCRFQLSQKSAVLSAEAVSYVVSTDQKPTPVPDYEIEQVKRALEAGAVPQALPGLAIGQKVRVEYGALQDIEGTLIRFGEKARLVVSISLLNRSVSLEIDRDQVRAIQ